MPNELEPIVGQWYRHLDKGQTFTVVGVDADSDVIEIQHLDGDVEAVEPGGWAAMELEAAAEPEDWTAPLDDVEPDDLDYTDTQMSARDEREALEELRGRGREAWEDAAPSDQAAGDEDIEPPTAGEETAAEEVVAALERRSAAEPAPEIAEAVAAARGRPSEARWSQAELHTIRGRIEDRLAALRADIRRELEKYDSERYADLAGAVADPGDKSVADLLVDVDLAEVKRDVDELRDLEGGLMRLADGSYGLCIDCERPIDAARLHYLPGAARCVQCQQRAEARGGAHRTL